MDVATELEEGKKRTFCVDFYCDMIVSLISNWITSKDYMSPQEFFDYANYALVDLAKIIEY